MISRRSAPLAVALAAILLVASCSSGSSDSSSSKQASPKGPSSTVTRSAAGGPTTVSSTTSAPAATSVPSPSSTDGAGSAPTPAAPSAAGCTSGSGSVPAGAASRETIDVDGDGRPDTSWITTENGTTEVGITTAAGGGSQITYDSASPIPRRVLVANVDERGPVEMIVSDGRGASLYAFVDCRIQPVHNAQGRTYQFDLEDLRGNGTGIGCIDTSEGRRLVGLRAKDRTASRVSWTSTVIELDGLQARNGAQRSGSYDLPGERAKANLLDEITCGDRTMTADGVTERG